MTQTREGQQQPAMTPLTHATDNKHTSEQQCSFCNAAITNQEGIQIRSFDFGGLGGIYSIDPDLPGFTATYKPIIDKLTEAGYKENEDLFGAPYDFRLAGDGLAQASTAIICCSPCALLFAPAMTPC